MPTQEVHLGDVGSVFKLTLYDGDSIADISGASVKKIIFKKPGNLKVTKDAAFYTDGTDGILKYVAVTDDIDTTGEWQIQAMVTLSSGTWYSSIGLFTVYGNL